MDEDLGGMYAGVSQLVAGLAANPQTVGSVAASLATFNFSASGPKLLKKLIGLIPGYDTFKQLQYLEAAALVDGMGAALASQATGIIAAAANALLEAAEAHTNALAAYTQAIADGLSPEAIAELLAAVEEASLELLKSERADQAVSGFINTLTDIANCKTRSQILDPT